MSPNPSKRHCLVFIVHFPCNNSIHSISPFFFFFIKKKTMSCISSTNSNKKCYQIYDIQNIILIFFFHNVQYIFHTTKKWNQEKDSISYLDSIAIFYVSSKSLKQPLLISTLSYFFSKSTIDSQCTVPGNWSTAVTLSIRYPCSIKVSKSLARLVGLQLIYTIRSTP